MPANHVDKDQLPEPVTSTIMTASDVRTIFPFLEAITVTLAELPGYRWICLTGLSKVRETPIGLGTSSGALSGATGRPLLSTMGPAARATGSSPEAGLEMILFANDVST